jgi:hypothetical protein
MSQVQQTYLSDCSLEEVEADYFDVDRWLPKGSDLWSIKWYD